jgi:hypothetical protein
VVCKVIWSFVLLLRIILARRNSVSVGSNLV